MVYLSILKQTSLPFNFVETKITSFLCVFKFIFVFSFFRSSRSSSEDSSQRRSHSRSRSRSRSGSQEHSRSLERSRTPVDEIDFGEAQRRRPKPSVDDISFGEAARRAAYKRVGPEPGSFGSPDRRGRGYTPPYAEPDRRMRVR